MSDKTRLITLDDCLVRVIRLRNHLGSQKALADKLGISEQYLSDMLRGRRTISDELMDAIGVVRYMTYEAEEEWKP